MTERRLRLATATFALMGAGVAAYLVYERYSGGAIACLAGGGCETVQRSSYALLAGIPVAVLGLVVYLLIAALSFVRGDPARAAVLGLALAGVAFSGYLLWAQAVPIGVFCHWCLISDALMGLVAVASLLATLTAAPRPLRS